MARIAYGRFVGSAWRHGGQCCLAYAEFPRAFAGWGAGPLFLLVSSVAGLLSFLPAAANAPYEDHVLAGDLEFSNAV